MNLEKDIYLPNVPEILTKYPDKIPVIIENQKGADQHRFLIGNNITLAQFMVVFRKKLQLDPNDAIYMYAKKRKSYHLITSSSSFINIYNSYKEDSGLLIMKYAKDNVFG